jgi:hypothetical protein
MGVTFADSLLHLVRAGARIDSGRDPRASAIERRLDVEPLPNRSTAAAPLREQLAALADEASGLEAASESFLEAGSESFLEPGSESFLEPGFADIEAAVALVEAGLATRVVLTGFRSWPGLLWKAYQTVESTDILILPTVVHPGGRVDIVIERETATDG